MEAAWTAILGAVQGATEFLPVSSSGHLALGQMLLEGAGAHGAAPAHPLLLEILLHVATLFAVIAIYRREVLGAIVGAGRAAAALFSGRLAALCASDEGANLAVAILVGTIPTAAVALLLEEPAVALGRNPVGLGACFLACACVLASTYWWRGGRRRLDWRAALVIGLFQGVAALPGLSRSGTTIAVALALGMEREEAARFSFLLSIPAIAGAAILEVDLAAMATGGMLGAYALGAVVAFATGLAALLLIIRAVRGGRLWLFAPYVAAVGVVSILLF